MPPSRVIWGLAVALALTACGGKSHDSRLPRPPKPPKAAKAPKVAKAPKARPNDWHMLATQADRDRLARWRTAWMTGLDKATTTGSGAQITAQGGLLKPDFALDDPTLPVGAYACRVIKMGAQGPSMLNYVAYPAFTCRVSLLDGRLHLAKLDGSQRPVGDIFPDEGRRMIFLGAMSLGDETRPLTYGRDSERDMAGILEKVGPARWRIAFPYPRWESTIDVLELVPKG